MRVDFKIFKFLAATTLFSPALQLAQERKPRVRKPRMPIAKNTAVLEAAPEIAKRPRSGWLSGQLSLDTQEHGFNARLAVPSEPGSNKETYL